jgi:hypothetical protein
LIVSSMTIWSTKMHMNTYISKTSMMMETILLTNNVKCYVWWMAHTNQQGVHVKPRWTTTIHYIIHEQLKIHWKFDHRTYRTDWHKADITQPLSISLCQGTHK